MQIFGGIPFIMLQNDTWTTNKQWKMRWRANPLTSWGASYVRRFEECWHDWMQNQVQTQLFILLLVILLPLQHYCTLVFQPAAEMAQLLTDTMRGLLSAPGRIKCRHRSATCSSSSFLSYFFLCNTADLCFPASCWDGPAVDGHYEGTAVSSGQNQAQAPVCHLLQTISRLHKEAALKSPGQLPASCACGEHVSLDDGEILCGGGDALQEAVSGKTFLKIVMMRMLVML